MTRALAIASLCATAICGVKGAPRPPEKTAVASPGDAGTGELFPPNAPGQPSTGESSEAAEGDPLAKLAFFDAGPAAGADAGCDDAGAPAGGAR